MIRKLYCILTNIRPISLDSTGAQPYPGDVLIQGTKPLENYRQFY